MASIVNSGNFEQSLQQKQSKISGRKDFDKVVVVSMATRQVWWQEPYAQRTKNTTNINRIRADYVGNNRGWCFYHNALYLTSLFFDNGTWSKERANIFPSWTCRFVIYLYYILFELLLWTERYTFILYL